MFTWNKLKKPIIALSPMADMTDSAFCRIAKRFGAPVVFREMISAEGLIHGSKKSFEMGEFHEEERPIVQQLFGADTKSMAEATKIIDDAYSPDGFDINMGCPVYKITSNFNGAALMKDPKLAVSIIKEMKIATEKPVSVKLRLGWSKQTEILDFIRYVEDAGADLITVHGSTKEQGYSGTADWKMVGRAKELVSVPVLCNGDVHSAEVAPVALQESGCDGLLIARGALGAPWIFREIENTLSGKPNVPISNEEFIRTIKDHAQIHSELHGGNLVTFRKHLVWYFKGVRDAKSVREKLVRVTTLDELDSILNEFLESAE